ncbi:unnamed protein product [Auanema sp. JU1783]|nr:unnamed protein product [Auanema sp. JU1783]
MTDVNINVRLVSIPYSTRDSLDPCISKIVDEFNMGPYNILMQNDIDCDMFNQKCRSVVVDFPESKIIYFIYRGTNQVIQLLMQALPVTKNFLGLGQTKQYYVSASDTFWKNQKHIVMDPKYKDYKFIYTGHSLGGSLAFLSAMRAVIQGKIPGDQIELMTFGEPRSGHRSFTKQVKNYIKNDIRITQNSDNVPNFPKCTRSSIRNSVCNPNNDNSFYHHGLEYWFFNYSSPHDQYKICDGLPENEDPTCIDHRRNPTLLSIQSWIDHISYLGLNMFKYAHDMCKP